MRRSELDETDRRLLAELQRDAGEPATALARRLGISASQCARRVKRLESEGYIRRRVALLDGAKLGCGVVVFISVALKSQSDDVARDFEAAVRGHPSVTELYWMNGTYDFLLKFVAADLADFRRFLEETLTRHEGVDHIQSFFAVKEAKYETGVPFQE